MSTAPFFCSTLSSGMVGLGALSMGRSFFSDLHVTEL